MFHKIYKVPSIVAFTSLIIIGLAAGRAVGQPEEERVERINFKRSLTLPIRKIEEVNTQDVEALFDNRAPELRAKIDQITLAYRQFMFPISQDEFEGIARALDINSETGDVLYKRAESFSSLRRSRKGLSPVATLHAFGTSIVALRTKNLETALASVTDDNFAATVEDYKEPILDIAKALPHFAHVYIPSASFSDAVKQYAGRVSPEAFHNAAESLGFAAMAGDNPVIRGDGGIALWLTLLAKAN